MHFSTWDTCRLVRARVECRIWLLKLSPRERTRVGCRSSVERSGLERSVWRDQVFRKKPERSKTPLLGGLHRGGGGEHRKNFFPWEHSVQQDTAYRSSGEGWGLPPPPWAPMAGTDCPFQIFGKTPGSSPAGKTPSLLIRKVQTDPVSRNSTSGP